MDGENGKPNVVQLANTWVIINVGGGPTDDKPAVYLRTSEGWRGCQQLHEHPRREHRECYERWKGLGAEFSPNRRFTRPRRGATCAIPTATSSRSARRKSSGESRDRADGGHGLELSANDNPSSAPARLWIDLARRIHMERYQDGIAPRWGCARSGDGSLKAGGIRAERAWKGRHRGFERRAFVDGNRRPRLSGKGRLRHLRSALRQRRVQPPSASREQRPRRSTTRCST